MPTAPPSRISDSPLFRELRESVAKETVAVTFACGGSVPVVPSLVDAAEEADDEALRATSCLPIDLRWDSDEKATLSSETKLTLPLEPNTENNLDRLIKDMTPATFGRGGEHVYDESYRKALKLDPTRFSSTFNPYELGIVDTIAQTLLPSLRHSQQTRSVKAELYKLNASLYSGPSGKFKAHVDTPRSPTQFGSLVVCLPLEHRGGALEVRHKGKTVTFDWSNSKDDGKGASVGWAAFYSDCEHEVLEVTEGHRLTLTYNLFCVRGNGQLGGNCPWLDATHLPLYKTVLALVQDDGWEKGGYLGYNCSHAYPHTSRTKLNFLAPDNLKGADMLMYEIFRSLGLKVSFRPVVTDLHYSDEGGDARPVVGLELPWAMWGFLDDSELQETYDEWTGKVPGAYMKRHRWYWTRDRTRTRQPEPEPEPTPLPEYVRFEDIHWLNDLGHREPQISWTAYGNEPSTMTTYSYCALIVEVPPRGSQEAEDGETGQSA
ncbi:395e13ec-bd05-4163-82fc-4c0ce8aa25bc [Thermothielavioides terrestris]|uniref:395e13ec-bd05-4163-82fc-4c0ce8aa25bc n=1 Tax=Thermothielavioides terrestris TaxID=2587410 RepID=A0A3S4AQI5_9PEZI|nr:395e13ec-bd05-4163-82fc-4c0ce8aa25bc [Thermothielavioides terrestris]